MEYLTYGYVALVGILFLAYGRVRLKRYRKERQIAKRRAQFHEVNSKVDEILRKRGF